MKPVDIVLIIVIALILGLAVLYIVNAKKNGQKCIGCPHSKTCSKMNKDNNCCSCSQNEKK